jgi:hypothetical protein
MPLQGVWQDQPKSSFDVRNTSESKFFFPIASSGLVFIFNLIFSSIFLHHIGYVIIKWHGISIGYSSEKVIVEKKTKKNGRTRSKDSISEERRM